METLATGPRGITSESLSGSVVVALLHSGTEDETPRTSPTANLAED